MNLTVKSIPGFRPFAIGVPKDGTLFLNSTGKPERVKTAQRHNWHEVLVREDPEERGGEGVTVPVYDVPEGYRPVRFGPVKPGELTADSQEDEGVFCWANPDDEVSFLVVEPDSVKKETSDGTLTVESIEDFVPFAVGIPEDGEYYLAEGRHVSALNHRWHEVLLRFTPGEPAGNEYTIPVYGVPEGYRPVRHGQVQAGDLTISTGGSVNKWAGDSGFSEWLIVEPVKTNTVKVKAPIGFKPVAIRVPNQGDLIYSDGIVRTAWAGGCPRLIVERHQANPENPPVLGEVGFFNDELELAELTGYDSHLKLYQNAEGSYYTFKVGLDAGEVELKVEVPDGYRAVRWGAPKSEESYLEEGGSIRTGSWFAERLIIEPLEPQWKEPILAEGQPARFWDNGRTKKAEGYLYGTGYVHKRGKVFIDEAELLWDNCEVKS